MEHTSEPHHAVNVNGTQVRYHISNGRIAIQGFDVNTYVQKNWTGDKSVFNDPALRNELEAELFGKVYQLVKPH